MKRALTIVLILLFRSSTFANLLTPTIVWPTNGSTNITPNSYIEWTSITGATAYEFKLSTNATLNLASIVTINGLSHTWATNPLFGTIYYWQVRAIKTTAPIDSSIWSTIYNFTTIDQLTLISPVNGAINIEPNILLDWSEITGIPNYDYELDTTPLFNSPLDFIASTGTASQINTVNLRFGTTYYWRARANNSVDTMQWSAVSSFTTTDQLTLISPVNGATNIEPITVLEWSGLPGILNYEYELDTTLLFNSTLDLKASSGTTPQIYTANLRFGTTYYWRARSRNAVDTTQWSPVGYFTTINQLTLIFPFNGTLDVSPDILLDWVGIAGISNYDYELDTVNTFNSPHKFYSSTGTSSQINAANLRFGTTYYWRVRGRNTADTSQWSIIRNFNTVNQIILNSPANGNMNSEVSESLNWFNITGITNYDYEIDSNSTFNSPVNFYSSTGTTSQIYTPNLRFGTTYYWRVRARHSADTMQWSVTRNFTTLDKVFLFSPSTNTTGINTNPTLSWNYTQGILGYEYCYSINSDFSSSISSTTGITSQANLSNLLYGTQYYWKVRAFHATDTSGWSLVWVFTTTYQLVSSPTLISPLNNINNASPSGTTIQWTSVNLATHYEFKISDNPSFTNPITNTVTTTNSNSGILQPITAYYWKVRASNSLGNSPWSTTWIFATTSTTSIENISGTDKYSIYPNPSNGKFLIKAPHALQSIEIYNSAGKFVYRIINPKIETEVELRNTDKGIYIIKLQEDSNLITKETIIQ